MSLRRGLWASPLAASVGVLAHFVVFGASHAPGEGRAGTILAAIGLALVAGVAFAFAGGWRGRRPSIATERGFGYGAIVLAAAGAASFGLIELSEGHLALRPLLEASLASLPLAVLVRLAGRTAGRLAYRAGASCATATLRARRRASGPQYRRVHARRLAPVLAPVSSSTQGRAPPHSR